MNETLEEQVRNASWETPPELSIEASVGVGYFIVIVGGWFVSEVMQRTLGRSLDDLLPVAVNVIIFIFGGPLVAAVLSVVIDAVRARRWWTRQVRNVQRLDQRVTMDALTIVFYVWESSSEGLGLGAWYRHEDELHRMFGVFIDNGDDAHGRNLLAALATVAEGCSDVTCYVDYYQGDRSLWVLPADTPDLANQLRELRNESQNNLKWLATLAAKHGPKPGCERAALLSELLGGMREGLLPIPETASSTQDDPYRNPATALLTGATREQTRLEPSIERTTVFQFASAKWPSPSGRFSTSTRLLLRMFVGVPLVLTVITIVLITLSDAVRAILKSWFGPQLDCSICDGIVTAVIILSSLLVLVWGVVGIPGKDKRLQQRWLSKKLTELQSKTWRAPIALVLKTELTIEHSSRSGTTKTFSAGLGAVVLDTDATPLFAFSLPEAHMLPHRNEFTATNVLLTLRRLNPTCSWHLWSLAITNETTEMLARVPTTKDSAPRIPHGWPEEHRELLNKLLEAITSLHVTQRLEQESTTQPVTTQTRSELTSSNVVELLVNGRWTAPPPRVEDADATFGFTLAAILLPIALWLATPPLLGWQLLDHPSTMFVVWLLSLLITIVMGMLVAQGPLNSAFARRQSTRQLRAWKSALLRPLKGLQPNTALQLVLRSYQLEHDDGSTTEQLGLALVKSGLPVHELVSCQGKLEKPPVPFFPCEDLLRELKRRLGTQTPTIWIGAVTNNQVIGEACLSQPPESVVDDLKTWPVAHRSVLATGLRTLQQAQLLPPGIERFILTLLAGETL